MNTGQNSIFVNDRSQNHRYNKGMNLTDQIVDCLAPLADPARAPTMRAYMKDQYSFLGIPTPVRRSAVTAVLRAAGPLPVPALLDASRALWAMPERECQYAALDMLGHCRALLGPDHLDHLLGLVRTKSWWDTVDALATLSGSIVRRHRTEQPRMDTCLRDPDLWVRRVAMLHQLGWKADTDAARLFSYARHLAPETDFFIRKAIGWALRDYARHDPAAVAAFLAAEAGRLSPLTRREAAKHL
jgi:3-methyladenine DNA glycosylase AlkD